MAIKGRDAGEIFDDGTGEIVTVGANRAVLLGALSGLFVDEVTLPYQSVHCALCQLVGGTYDDALGYSKVSISMSRQSQGRDVGPHASF